MIQSAPYSNPQLYNDYYNYNVPADLVKSPAINSKSLSADIHPLAGKPLAFKTVKEGIILRPLYDIHRERYVVYWNVK